MIVKILSAAATAALVAFATGCAQDGGAGSSAGGTSATGTSSAAGASAAGGGSMSPRSPAGSTTTAGECRGLEGEALNNCVKRQGSAGPGSRTTQ